MSTTSDTRIAGRSLVPAETFERFVRFVVVENGQTEEHAKGIVDQALCWFGAVAVNDGPPLMPSASVDLGVHAIYLHTREAAALFEQIAGRFIHHNPHPERGGRPAASLVSTVAAIEAAGYQSIAKFWSDAPGGMSQCDSDDGRDY